MTEKCHTPEQDCPFDRETIEGIAKMQERVEQMHKLLMNGEGLVFRVGSLERWRAYVIGIAVACSVIGGLVVKLLPIGGK